MALFDAFWSILEQCSEIDSTRKSTKIRKKTGLQIPVKVVANKMTRKNCQMRHLDQ